MTDTTATADTPSTDTGNGGAASAPAGGETILTTQPTPGTDGAAEGQGADGGEGQGKAPEANKDDQAKAPAEYTDFAMPEGMQVDAAMLGQFKPIAQELGLSQEQAQKFVSLYAEKMKGDAAAGVKAWADQMQAWGDTARVDKEFGGAQFDANLGLAKQALDKFGTPELSTYLNEFGAGNHPEVIRLFYRIGKAISDDAFHQGSGAGKPTDPAHIMFPADAPKGT